MDEALAEQIDPRVQDELERLNEASKLINQLENKLSDTRNEYRTALSESTTQLNNLHKKLGDCVSKARPFYDAKQVAKDAQLETLLAAVRFERAVSMHSAAREMVAVAEQGMENGGDTSTTDTAWQEMLNHATLKVNEAEIERLASETEHHEKMDVFKKAEGNMNALQKKLKFNIARSRKYFELKEKTNIRIQSLVNAVNAAEKKIIEAKAQYSEALRNLESISNSIHEARKSLGVREEGVGAESEPQITDPSQNEDLNLELLKPTGIQKSPNIHTASTEPQGMKKVSPTLPRRASELLLSVADLSQIQCS